MRNNKKETKRLPMPAKVKQGLRCYCTLVMAVALLGCCSMTAFAADDPLEVVNNLSEFIFGLIRAVGLILLGWGIVQVGLSLQSHDRPAVQRLPHPCGRHCYNLCEGDFDPYHRLMMQSYPNTGGRAPKACP